MNWTFLLAQTAVFATFLGVGLAAVAAFGQQAPTTRPDRSKRSAVAATSSIAHWHG